MNIDALDGEIVGLISRLKSNLIIDARVIRALSLDSPEASKDLVLAGIEDAIVGLVLLHIQLRRKA